MNTLSHQKLDLPPAERRAVAARTHEAYRADIDGLRAIAVLPVVLFHASVRGFSGGFVGVDIFFVISGYLITGILVRDIAIGRHSILEFYRRRILRIFPALAVVMIATTVAAWLFLMPAEQEGNARALASTALFLSNVQFYLTADYFNPDATSQPLLHTWSLAVEEQWYIVWPVILAAIGAARAGMQRLAALSITVGSFAISLWLLPVDPAASFYLLPARAWELGLGALAAMVAVAPNRYRDELMGLAGILLIALSVKFYTHETAFPGLAALPPCMGAALVIVSGRSPTLAARVLACAPLRWVGLISYSLYLWHWPVIVFAETGLLMGRSLAVSAGTVGLSILLAWLSYRFVERPFRRGVSDWSTPGVLAGGVVTLAGFLALAAATPTAARFVNPFTPSQVATARFLSFDGDGAYRRNRCFQVGPRGRFDAAYCLSMSGRRPAVLLAGDSHAAHLWPGLSHYENHADLLQATVTGCVASLYPKPRDSCQRFENHILHDWLKDHRVDVAILSSRWHEGDLDALRTSLRDPVVRAAHPILIGPMPEYTTALPRILVWADRREDPDLPGRLIDRSTFRLDALMAALARSMDVPYVSPIRLLCDTTRCRTNAANGTPMQWDRNHLTPAGSALLAHAIWARSGLAGGAIDRRSYRPALR